MLTPRGALDPAFGAGFGWGRLDFSSSDAVTAVGQQSNGPIVAAGTTSSPNGFVAGILNPGGTLDPAFGAGNGVFRPAFADATLLSLAVQPDDRVVVGGIVAGVPPEFFNTDMVVARLSPGGAIDPTYGGGFGWSRVSFPGPAGLELATGVGILPDGKIVVAGFTPSPVPGIGSFGVARLLNPQGTFDASFGSAGNGTVAIPVGANGLAGPAVAVQPDGAIVLAGRNESSAIVVRLRAAGTPDVGFSGDGTAVAGPGAFRAVAAQRDGKIVAAGETPGPGGKADVLVMRFQPNGQPDTTFGGGDGRVTVDLGGADGATALAIQPDGRILVGVNTDANADVVVLRLQGDAAPGSGPGGPGAGPGGGAGPAAARCAGRPATVIGSAGRDRPRGTAGVDVIVGLGGDDVIEGLGGADIVCGGAGADVLKGGAGADRLLGEDGVDVLMGGAGADVLIGGAGRDRLLGGAGRDRLLGGAGADRLLGGGGVDVLSGGPGRNVSIQ